jgi:hypothetical protein
MKDGLRIARGLSLPLELVTQATGILAKRRAGNYRMEASGAHRFCIRCRWCSAWGKPKGFGTCELKRRAFPEDPRVRLAGVCDYFEVPD